MRRECKVSTLFLALLTVVISSSAHGMVYSWLDSAGIAHYTNKEYEIPARYREKVKVRYSESGTPRRDVAAPPVMPENQPPKPAQQIMPETLAKPVQPVALPTPQVITKKQSAKQRRRNRVGAEEE